MLSKHPSKWQTFAAAVAVARDKLTVFNQQMRAHFEMEEEGGYMEEAVRGCPCYHTMPTS